jgi:hypothetical protein
MQSDLLALAERCEQTTGPDRELDGSIWWATLSADAVEHFDPTGFVRKCIDHDGSAGVALAQFFDSANPTCLARIAFDRAYTASLDSAMALVPDSADAAGERFRLEHWNSHGVHVPHVRASAWVAGAHRVYAATPALALTAAALRARAALATQENINHGR